MPGTAEGRERQPRLGAVPWLPWLPPAAPGCDGRVPETIPRRAGVSPAASLPPSHGTNRGPGHWQGMCILAIGRSSLGGVSDLRRCQKSFAALVILVCALALASCAGYGKPNQPAMELAFGVDMARRGLWNEALFRFHEAEKADPENPRVHNNLGVAYEAQGDFEKALAHYKRALQLAPENRQMRANYARFVEFYQSYKSPEKAKQGKGFPMPKGATGSGGAAASPGQPPPPAVNPPAAGPPEPSNVPPGPATAPGSPGSPGAHVPPVQAPPADLPPPIGTQPPPNVVQPPPAPGASLPGVSS